MGLQLPKRMPGRARRAGITLASLATLSLAAGCSAQSKEEWERLAQPLISEGATNHTDALYELWAYSWLAAIITGVLVWGLIAYAVVKFRRRSDDEIPVQTRYNLPLEILYTLAPVVMVLVFFYFTVDVQKQIEEKSEEPDHVVAVVGQQWSWTFNYVKDDLLDGETTVYQPGTTNDLPTLYLVEGESVRFDLTSPDVIHDFWIPGFLMKMDVVPGKPNSFELTPTRAGVYKGKCAELCGVYHSRMLFNVEVVDRATYTAKLRELQEAGFVGLACGGDEARTIAGYEDPESESADANDEECK